MNEFQHDLLALANNIACEIAAQLSNESLIQVLAERNIAYIKAQQRFADCPLAAPRVTPSRTWEDDILWAEAIRRGLNEQITEQVKSAFPPHTNDVITESQLIAWGADDFLICPLCGYHLIDITTHSDQERRFIHSDKK